MAAAARGEVSGPDAGGDDRPPREPREPREGGRRERGNRRPRAERSDAPVEGQPSGASFDDQPRSFADTGVTAAQSVEGASTASNATATGSESVEGQDGNAERAPRERRSRDRYGRDRRERGERAAPGEAGDQAEGSEGLQAAPEGFDGRGAQASDEQAQAQARDQRAEREPRAEREARAERQPRPAEPMVVAASPAVVTVAPVASVAAAQGMPTVANYELPLQDLAQVASASGLQWVNSNAAKIAEIQTAMASEPRPVQVPRERPPVVQVDNGPLVLVETKRDLRNMTLPFEQADDRNA